MMFKSCMHPRPPAHSSLLPRARTSDQAGMSMTTHHFHLHAYGQRDMCISLKRRGFFISIFFISVFYKNIFLIWKFTEIYPGRPAAGRHGLILKKKKKKNCRQVPGAGRPAAGRPAPLAARLRGGRPPLAARLLGDRLSHPI